MFQGSESLPKLEHFRLVQSSGGVFNGSTHTDYTDYFEVMPAAALERALFLEADRMRAPRITAENLANQVDVVSEEIRLNVLNRPYGGFPWVYLPAVLFTSFANAHNGYGDFVDLRSATVEDCADFFGTYYTPANAVLTVCGDFEVDAAFELVDRHFDDIRGGPAPRAPVLRRAVARARARGRARRPVRPRPGACRRLAVAGSGRRPGRSTWPSSRCPAMLTDGESSRLQSAVVARSGLATDIWSGPGLLGGPWTRGIPTCSCSARSTRRRCPRNR